MYAVVRTGGKQYRVQEGDVLRVEKLEAAEGSALTLDEVLMLGAEGEEPRFGQPLVQGAAVRVQVRRHGKGEKIKIIKLRRRKHYRRRRGHRQQYTEIVVEAIVAQNT